TARVDAQRREGIRRAHSATHILHHALQKTLGSHAQQQGSKVDDDWLRFDFTNPSAMSADQLQAVQHDVRGKIESPAPIQWEIVPLAAARAAGAMMLFGEKYPDPVRMVSMGQFSKELCGGTHLTDTAEVGAFEVVSEESVAAGTRRITALTGEKARQHVAEAQQLLAAAATALEVQPAQVPAAAVALSQHVRDLKKRLAGSSAGGDALDLASAASDPRPATALLQTTAATLKVGQQDVPARLTALRKDQQQLTSQLATLDSSQAISLDSLLDQAIDVGGTRLIVAEAPGANPNQMRSLIDQLRRQAAPIAVLLASSPGPDKVLLVAGISHDLEQQGLHAGNWVRDVAKLVGGSGGGKPSLAQAGGKQVDKLPDALAAARRHLQDSLAGAS
ncbi:MAG: DHHA1 domain-containing protein, partial [Planctomycetota bacterium]|nr:DHHA1 domain-containing protein [Planctomycetota bacterium]